MSGLFRLLYRNSNSATYSGRYLRLTLWSCPRCRASTEAVDCLSVDNAVNLLLGSVPRDAMRKFLAEVPIARMFVGRDQADLFGHGGTNEGVESLCVGVSDHARHDVTLAADRIDHWRLARTFRPDAAAFLVPMPVVILAADVGFINLDNAHELAKVGINEPSTNAVAHIVRGLVRTETHHAVDLQ